MLVVRLVLVIRAPVATLNRECTQMHIIVFVYDTGGRLDGNSDCAERPSSGIFSSDCIVRKASLGALCLRTSRVL